MFPDTEKCGVGHDGQTAMRDWSQVTELQDGVTDTAYVTGRDYPGPLPQNDMMR